MPEGPRRRRLRKAFLPLKCQHNGSEAAPSGDDQVPNAHATTPAVQRRSAVQLRPTLSLCGTPPFDMSMAVDHDRPAKRSCSDKRPHATVRVAVQPRAAWDGVAEELLRQDPAAAARFQKLAEAERRVSELMVLSALPAERVSQEVRMLPARWS